MVDDEDAGKTSNGDAMDVRYVRGENAPAEAGDEQIVACAYEEGGEDYEGA